LEAYYLELADDEQLKQVTSFTEALLASGRAPGDVASKITGLATESYGELIYSFCIWKDNILEVAQRVLEVLEHALGQEFGTAWPKLKFSDKALFVHLYNDLGGMFRGPAARHNLTPILKRKGTLTFSLFMHGGSDDDEDGEDDKGSAGLDTSRFESFTAELMAANEESEPDAFDDHQGGKGVAVRIVGLQARPEFNGCAARISSPVELESGRWPVKLVEGGAVFLVKRQNLEAM